MSTPRAKRSAKDLWERFQKANAAWKAENGDSTSKIPAEVWQAVRQSSYVRYMNKLTCEGETIFPHILFGRLMLELGIVLPRSVIVRTPRIPGARKKNVNEKICERWEQDGRPQITNRYCLKLAREFLPSECARAKTRARQKDLLDKVRIMLLRKSKRAPLTPEQKDMAEKLGAYAAWQDRILSDFKSQAATDFTE